MAESLAVKYRPHIFEDVSSQYSVIKILRRQLELKQFKNCYLFCGPSGCGKTTLARIFANEINEGKGSPIEIDGASNNGVDNVKTIINDAKARSIDSKYKVYIIDECHAITNQGWQAFLKCIEEPPVYTIFMFCTTDPQKIPATIHNRVMKFNLTKVETKQIENRLNFICNNEGFTNYQDSTSYISKICNGGMRDAISMLEKVAGLSTDISIENTLTALGNYSYESFFELTNALIDAKMDIIINIIEDYNNKGNDLKLFIDQYLDFILDLDKYCIFHDMNIVKLPINMKPLIDYATNIKNNTKYYSWLVDKILNIKNAIKYDTSIKTTIEIMLLSISRGE